MLLHVSRYRRSAMLEALAGLNDQPSQAPVQEQPLPAAMALTATEMFTSALTSMGQPGQQARSQGAADHGHLARA